VPGNARPTFVRKERTKYEGRATREHPFSSSWVLPPRRRYPTLPRGSLPVSAGPPDSRLGRRSLGERHGETVGPSLAPPHHTPVS
jgi:hypothetical protein